MKLRMLTWTAAMFALGVIAEYFLDPDRGRARRAQVSAQGGARVRRSVRHGQRALRYESNKLAGRRYAMTHPGSPPEDDDVLVQKIRSEILGRAEFRDLHLVVDAFGGVVHLRGAVTDPATEDAVRRAVEAVDGVTRVESLLHRPGEPAPNKAAAMSHH